MRYPAGTLEVLGRNFELEVDPYSHIAPFSTEVNGVRLYGETVDKLRSSVATQLRKAKAKIDVKFSRLSPSGRGVERGTVYGRHSGNQNLLVRWASGHTEQLNTGGGCLAPLTEPEEREYVRLHQEARAATEALRKFTADHQIWLEKLVDEALTAEAKKQEAKEEKQ